MKPKVYIETTVVSYYTAWPSRDVVVAGHQQITRDWWRSRLPLFDGVVSELVLQEAEKGDPDAAAARLEAVAGFPVLTPGTEAGTLADGLVAEGLVPREYINDAIHITIAATNGVEFLVTWNCKHLANALTRNRMTAWIEAFGYECPVICTPEELMEETP
jgi:hypothetical protein